MMPGRGAYMVLERGKKEEKRKRKKEKKATGVAEKTTKG